MYNLIRVVLSEIGLDEIVCLKLLIKQLIAIPPYESYDFGTNIADGGSRKG